MKEYTNMRIGKKEFIKIMNSYLSEEEATKVNVNVICDDCGKDLSLEYYKTVKIKDVNTRVLVTVDKDEIISILSKFIPDYDIGEFRCCIEEGESRSIFFSSNDYVFDGVEFDLKPKQKQLSLEK